MLEKLSVLELHMQVMPSENEELNRMGIVEAKVKDDNNSVTMAYDLMDGYNFDTKIVAEYIDSVDFYFKRSFSKDINMNIFNENQSKKTYPLSLNYDVSYFFNPIDYNGSFSEILKVFTKKIARRNDVKYYEKGTDGLIYDCLFMCRLWNPDEISETSLKEERNRINEDRIKLIRALREEYGQRFIGGLQDNEIARKMCPDLIISQKLTQKNNYMKIMRNSKVCIATTGLHNSIGWKFAEYMAAGKAIVSEMLNYEPYGDLREGINYLGFNTGDEALKKIKDLLGNDSKRVSMEQANKEYYFKYQRPDKQILNSLRLAGIVSD
ncbi:glycosyltransferase [Butyrivibrio sp. AE3006]|uniref:glycosyltransferase n=1 Tax=Butyrivibrio sp. AE3006 TaxID=1280673 RepID=UPI0012DC6D89|nr:glycosyltransferase family 1 protein [Butyrivibrio sp. AE3006]